MRRLLSGAALLLFSIAVPATFHGTWFLITLWFLIGLAGLIFVVSSDPVRRRWLVYLKHQLDEIEDSPEAQQDPGEVRHLRVEVSAIIEELEHGLDVLNSSPRERDQFFAKHELATEKWKRYGAILAEEGYPEAHKEARRAYREIDAVNRSANRNVVDSAGRPTALLNSDRVRAARAAITDAIEHLQSIPLD